MGIKRMRENRKHNNFSVLLFVVVFIFAATSFSASIIDGETAHAITVPQRMGYEGQLKNSAGVDQTGTFNMVFRIYDVETGGSAIWTETHSSVSVSDGYFAASLGTSTALDLAFDKEYWISIEVDSACERSRMMLNRKCLQLCLLRRFGLWLRGH